MKKIITICLCLMLTFTLAACNNTSPDDGGQVQIPNPIVKHDSFEKALENVSFEMEISNEIKEMENLSFRTINQEIVEVQYETNKGAITIRKGAGKNNVSGIYQAYTTEKEVVIADMAGVLKGENNIFYLLTYGTDEFQYSIYAENGLSEEEIIGLAKEVK